MFSFTFNTKSKSLYFDKENDIAEKAKTFKKGVWKSHTSDLIVESVIKSTEQRDRNIKISDYDTHGVSKYWIVDADKATVEQYILIKTSTTYI